MLKDIVVNSIESFQKYVCPSHLVCPCVLIPLTVLLTQVSEKQPSKFMFSICMNVKLY
jgi:hypothetical protein